MGCPNLVKKGRCPKHARTHARKKRSQPRYDVYKDPRWQATKRRAKARCGHQCQALDGGVRCPVTFGLHGHHDYPGGVEAMLRDGVDPFDESRVVMLCDSHHGKLTAWERAQERRGRR